MKPTGFYKGQPAPVDSVKFKTEFQGIPINVDRPKGFIMKGTGANGKDWSRKYQYDYGFIPKTLGGDEDGLDVFIGPDKKQQYAYWAVQRDDEGNFDEYKVFLGFPDRDAAIAVYRQHIPKKYFNGMMTLKVEMMKAMLGKVNPDEKIKRAAAMGMLDELQWISKTSSEITKQQVKDKAQAVLDTGLSASKKEVGDALKSVSRPGIRRQFMGAVKKLDAGSGSGA